MTDATRNSLTTEYTYNDASWVTKIDYPNSTNTNYTYNSRGWMTAIDLKDSSNNTIFSLPYTYDANGNVTEETIGNDTISYTYDALNRLTFIDRPGTTNDTTYTYDERGNRTEMETGSVTNYLTFNVADRLTRVDKPSNAYDTYTYDYNGNLTQMDRYYPTPLLNNSPQTDKTTENTTENRNSLLMTHYPSDYLPSPENKWDNLSPYLPDLSKIDPLDAKLAQFFPEKAKYDRQERLRRISRPDPTPDETTTYTYSSDNNMTHADLTDGSDLDFAYDAAGRRLEKKYTKVINNVTYETKYTYHYIGSQITTIDISGKEDETITKNDQMRIHLGANSRPISFEYYTDIGTEQQASETYYYHYDLHGNVIRVTDDAGTTEITYTYDALGTIVSETNTNSIYNPFTWSGEAQVINDPEFDTSAASPKTGLYNSGSGYYNPETGTFLSGTGMPADVNPTSTRHEDVSAMLTRPMSQQASSGSSASIAGCVYGGGESAESSNSVEPEGECQGLGGGSSPESDLIPSLGGNNQLSPTPGLGIWAGEGPDPKDMKFDGATGLGGIGDNFILPGPRKIGTGGGTRTLKTGCDITGKLVCSNGTTVELVDLDDETVNMLVDAMNQAAVDKENGTTSTAAANDDPAKDGPESAGDDGTQYNWVQRDKNGNITACQKKNGDTYIYDTDSNGNRKNPPKRLTNPDDMAKSWKNICNNIENGKQPEMEFYDANGYPTLGSASMDIGGGKWWTIYNGYDGYDDAKSGNGRHNFVKKDQSGSDIGFAGTNKDYKGGKGTVISFMETDADEAKSWVKTYYNPANKEKYHKWLPSDEKANTNPPGFHIDGDGSYDHWYVGNDKKGKKCKCGHYDKNGVPIIP